jgi:urea transport system ATP-binding protein
VAELFFDVKGKHSLMVVEHDMSFIRLFLKSSRFSDESEGNADQAAVDERVIEVYLGR